MKTRIGMDSEQEPEDDGFLEALKGVSEEDWKVMEDEDEEKTDI